MFNRNLDLADAISAVRTASALADNTNRPGGFVAVYVDAWQHMRRWVLPMVLSVALATSCADAVAAEREVRVLRDGQPLVVGRAESIAAKLIAVAESCSVSSTAFAVASNTWELASASGSYVQVTFQSPRSLNLMIGNGRGREPHDVHALLLPLPEGHWPAHLYAQVAGQVFSLTKYNPRSLSDLALEPDLQLATVRPYSSLAGARGAR